MSFSSFIAGRYLRSGRNAGFVSFITGIAVLGIMLGTAALIIALTVLGGFERQITEKVVGFTSHVQVLRYQNLPVTDYVAKERLIARRFPIVASVSPYVAREALIRSRAGVDGILLKGIDPDNDNSTTRRYMVAGAYEFSREHGGMPKIVIGRKLASRLAVEVGDKVAVFGIGRFVDAGQARVMQFRVAGIYESGMAEYDDVYAFTNLSDAQTLFQIPGAVSGFDLMLKAPDSAEAVAAAIPGLLGDRHHAQTVFDSYRNLFSWIELQKKPVPIILGLIIIVATVNIIGTLLMMVLDRTREIGILTSMGATRWDVTRIFLRQGFIIAVTGTLLGDVLAFGLCWSQLHFRFFSLPSDIYFMSSVPILLKPEYFLLVSFLAVALSMVSAFVPARLAALLRPVDAIRFS